MGLTLSEQNSRNASSGWTHARREVYAERLRQRHAASGRKTTEPKAEPMPKAEARPRRRPKGVGTQHWLEDPSLPVCSFEGCRYDAGSCKHRGTRPRAVR
jgi:hypothetical protein